MKSGLEDRNNEGVRRARVTVRPSLNEVRPGRPEQFYDWVDKGQVPAYVSMKSGLEDRNNGPGTGRKGVPPQGLNEVRPGRPEQSTEYLTVIEEPVTLTSQ